MPTGERSVFHVVGAICSAALTDGNDLRRVRSRQFRGAAGLRRILRPGRPPKLARGRLAQLPRLLARGAEAYGFPSPVWTTQRVADLLWQRFRVRYDRDHVCRLLHRFGWSWQKPTGRARERDERAIQRWVQRTWPRIKKTPAT